MSYASDDDDCVNSPDIDSHFSDSSMFYDDEYQFIDACIDGDHEAVQAILEDDCTREEINERDRSGRTGISHACSSGFSTIVEMLAEVPEVEVNIPDKEGNTPLIFAAQAGQEECVRILLHEYKKIRVDHVNKAGFSALMKAAIQGRTKCAKLLLFAGSSPKLRDYGRKLCAEEWARFTGRYDCAEAIAKFTKAKRFVLRTRFQNSRNKSCSEPDLSCQATPETNDGHSKNVDSNSEHRTRQSWFRKKFKKLLHIQHDMFSRHIGSEMELGGSPFQMIARCVSTPLIPGAISPSDSPPSMRKNNGSEGIKIPRVEVTTADTNVSKQIAEDPS
ncbi:uncharacterized protein LOC115217241 [Octopus sinensis]|nr:uncharacterized protein LOC115217241 [Octopus sinensis]